MNLSLQVISIGGTSPRLDFCSCCKYRDYILFFCDSSWGLPLLCDFVIWFNCFWIIVLLSLRYLYSYNPLLNFQELLLYPSLESKDWEGWRVLSWDESPVICSLIILPLFFCREEIIKNAFSKNFSCFSCKGGLVFFGAVSLGLMENPEEQLHWGCKVGEEMLVMEGEDPSESMLARLEELRRKHQEQHEELLRLQRERQRELQMAQEERLARMLRLGMRGALMYFSQRIGHILNWILFFMQLVLPILRMTSLWWQMTVLRLLPPLWMKKRMWSKFHPK